MRKPRFRALLLAALTGLVAQPLMSQTMGKLPPRPKVPQVQLVSREERPEYIVEKFQFDNLAGAIVPGYLIIPKRLAGGPCPGWMII